MCFCMRKSDIQGLLRYLVSSAKWECACACVCNCEEYRGWNESVNLVEDGRDSCACIEKKIFLVILSVLFVCYCFFHAHTHTHTHTHTYTNSHTHTHAQTYPLTYQHTPRVGQIVVCLVCLSIKVDFYTHVHQWRIADQLFHGTSPHAHVPHVNK